MVQVDDTLRHNSLLGNVIKLYQYKSDLIIGSTHTFPTANIPNVE